MWKLLLVLPGLIAAYLILLRPVLKAMPALKAFYDEADTFWQKAWAVCGNSLTMVWSYFLMIAGGLLNQVDNIAATLGDPNFKEQVAQIIGTDPKALGYFAMTVSAVTIAARLRSIAKG
jgi:hypothetical protein